MQTDHRHRPKALSQAAYDALSEALTFFFWYRGHQHDFIRAVLADAPGAIKNMDLSGTRREVAVRLVGLLRQNEGRYQDLTIDILVKLAEFDERFPRLARLEDGKAKVAIAKDVLEDIRRVTQAHRAEIKSREEAREAAEVRAAEILKRREHDIVLKSLYDRFVALSQSDEPHQRGRALESLLNDLFGLFGLHPRAAYRLDHEQIDGAFTFNTDDYLLEAKWRRLPIQADQLHIFKAKIETKAKNVMGLLLAINGFTAGAIELYSHGTPLLLMDGADLLCVLEGRISLPEVLDQKRRHAAETGCPMLPVRDML